METVGATVVLVVNVTGLAPTMNHYRIHCYIHCSFHCTLSCLFIVFVWICLRTPKTEMNQDEINTAAKRYNSTTHATFSWKGQLTLLYHTNVQTPKNIQVCTGEKIIHCIAHSMSKWPEHAAFWRFTSFGETSFVVADLTPCDIVHGQGNTAPSAILRPSRLIAS